MECESFAEIAGELARDGLMESTVRAGALDHAQVCPECGARLASEHGLNRALAFAAEAEVESAPQSVKSALVDAFAQRRALSTASNQAREANRIRAVRGRRFLQAAAAALLILLAAVTFYIMRSRATGPRNVENTAPPAVAVNPPKPAEGPQDTQPGGGKEGVREPGPSRPHFRRINTLKEQLASARVGNAVEPMPGSRTDSEAMTDFIPLTYLTRSTAIESGQVMRVKMPVSTFIALGVPINNQHADELVNAELVMGDDGVMRAVRLLK